jgi:predicted RNase H-like nuclease (RuvC/YqgF family)
MHTLSLEIGEVAKRVQVLGEKIEVAIKDVEKKLASRNTPKDRAPEGFNEFQENTNRILKKNESEMKQVAEAIKKITAEMKHMRYAIREKKIDSEL